MSLLCTCTCVCLPGQGSKRTRLENEHLPFALWLGDGTQVLKICLLRHLTITLKNCVCWEWGVR